MKKVKFLVIFFAVMMFFGGIITVNADSGDDSLMDSVVSEMTSSNKTYLKSKAKVGVNIPSNYTFSFGKVRKASATKTTGVDNKDLSSGKSAWGSYTNQDLTWRTIFSDYVSATAAHKTNENHDYTVCFPKLSVYNGDFIDVKGQILDYKVNKNVGKSGSDGYPEPAIMAITYGPGSLDRHPSVESLGVDWIKVKWSFTKSNSSNNCSGAAVNGVKGSTTYWDVDHQQGIMFYGDSNNKLYVYSSSNDLKYGTATWQSSDGATHSHKFVFADQNNSSSVKDKKYAFTEAFDTSSSNSITRVYTFYRTETEGARGGIQHSPQPVLPQDTPEPVKKVDKTYVGSNKTVKYTIRQDVPGQYSDYYYKSFVISDKTDSSLDVTSVKVIDVTDDSADVSNKFIIDTTPTIKVTAKSASLSDEDFYGKTYNVVITAKVKSGYDFSSYPSTGKCIAQQYSTINNVAKLTYQNKTEDDSKSLNSNNVEVCYVPDPKKNYDDQTKTGKNNAPVKVGDNITYHINYYNPNDETADITIIDNLGKGLTYKSASVNPSNNPSVGTDGKTQIKWVIPNVAGGGKGEFTYVAEVNKDAVLIVENDATVKVGNDDIVHLKILKNPVPVKEYAGTGLSDNKGWNHHEVLMPDTKKGRVGDDVKYKVTIPNVKNEAINVIVSDVLSNGLTYNNDAAVDKGTLSSSEPLINSETKTTNLVYTVNVPANTISVLTYSARVNENAENLVNNYAIATYGYAGDRTIDIGTLHNPVPKKHYDTETAKGMDGKIVQNEDVITYNLTYANGFKEPANIKLRDKLSKDLKYTEKTAKICDRNKENCKSITEAGVTEEITPNEDGTTLILWTRNNLPSLGEEMIVYDVVAEGEETRVENNFDIQICKASEYTCNNQFTDIDELKNPKPKKEYAPEPNAGYGHRAVAERSRIKYQIVYENVDEEKVTVTVKDNISKGIEFVNGTFKVDGKKIDDPKFSSDKKTFTLNRDLEKDQKEVLTYEVLVTGETTKVKNHATAEYSNNPGYVRELKELENPVPQKTYSKDTKAGKDGVVVKKNDVITYSIKYSNSKDETSSVIIMDNLSKGLEYVKGSSKVNGAPIDPVSVTKDSNGSMLVWVKEIAAGKEEELTYEVKVTGEKKLVENNASIQYDDDPVIKLDELRNPLLPEPKIVETKNVPIPNTGSNVKIAAVVLGTILVGSGGYLVYRRYKKA